ncbi:MAG: CocE/NonD family hydrolase [Acidimicrobiales bacterium]|nr:CocE/NonD family hydrolase [Acidimicrobiales bacterium]
MRRTPIHTRRASIVVVAVAVLVALGLTACDPAKKVLALGGTNQITVTTAPNALISLYDRNGNLVPTLEIGDTGDPVPVDARRTDENGNVVLRYIPTGYDYVVKRVDSDETAPSDPVTVTRVLQTPKRSLYLNQEMTEGFGYLKTRDGTLLSYMLRLPGPIDQGPYPTVVEYSGYDPSNPYKWSDTAPSQRIANLAGYAVVGVNIRGTGCSGGSFFLWEAAQATDGYDVVETVAAQPWVKGHKVGMVGLSYPGNAALYAAATQPPSLAAIAVGGTYDDGFRNLLRPSGITNSGFAQSWISGRESQAEAGGQEFTRQRIEDGDAICEFNQRMRTQNIDLTQRIAENPYFPTLLGLGDQFAPATMVSRIKVPVLLAATWHDEQVGGHVPTMLPNFTGTTKKRFLLTNGGHAEMLAVPDILLRWGEFLDLYVAKRTPNYDFYKLASPVVAKEVVGGSGDFSTVPFPANRFAGKTYAQALAAWEAEPQVRVSFENGGGSDGAEPGLAHPTFSQEFASYPVPGTAVQRWYLGPEGTLVADAPVAADDAEGTIDSYVSDPSVRPETSTTGGNAWAQYPQWDWAPPVDGKSLAYLSPALAQTTAMVGSGSVDLWLRSSAPDTDLQVTLTEVRPDGQEELVQSGWMRTSVRALDEARSTELQPLVTMMESDAAPLPAGEFTPVRVEIYPFGHVFRAGSKIRLILTAPGGDRIAWSFDTLDGTPTNEIARSAGRPSSVALPVVAGVTPPAELPACALRGQPCRPFPPAS